MLGCRVVKKLGIKIRPTQQLTEAQLSALSSLLQDSSEAEVTLPLIAALEELAATLQETSKGMQPPQSGDRGSLTQDVELALNKAGSDIREITKPSLREFRNRNIPQLKEILADPERSSSLCSKTEELIEQLRQPPSVEAAWNDLVAVVCGGGSMEECHMRSAQLKEIVGLRGHDWWPMRTELSEPLRNGDLDTCRTLLAADAPTDLVSVWVVFGNASLDAPMRRIGQIQFFNHQLTLQNIRDGCPALSSPDFERAHELSEDDIKSYFSEIPSEYFVYARVELSGARAKSPIRGPSQPPIEWGRHLAAAAVEAAAVRFGGTKWELLEGGCYFTADGTSGGTLGFDDPARVKAMKDFTPPPHERTGSALEELPSNFIDELASEQGDAVRAIHRVRWHETVSKAPDPAVRLMTFVKAFEDEWSAESGTWEDSTRRFLCDMWCRDTQDSILLTAGWKIRRLSQYGNPTVQAAAKAVYESTGSREFLVNLPAVGDHALKVAEAFPVGSLERRQFCEIARATQSGSNAQAWWKDLRGDFNTLLNRGVRQRNRIVHGRTMLPRLLGACEPFLARLATYLVVESVQGVAQGRSSQAVFEEQRTSLQEAFESLPSGPFSDLYNSK